MLKVGQLCVKIAGREAGKKCVVIKNIDSNFVIIDGDVKRRKCNVDHLLPLSKFLSIKSTTKSEEIKELFVKEGLMKKLVKHKERKKSKTQRPRKIHIKHEKKPEKKQVEKQAKKPEKKVTKKIVKKQTKTQTKPKSRK